MTTHMTLRLAWHNDGWNGRICKQPGELVAELEKPPACMYGVSTFSDRPSSSSLSHQTFSSENGACMKGWAG